MPTFTSPYVPPMPSSTIPTNLNQTVTAHIEQYQKTQNRLLARTQQRFLQGRPPYRMEDTSGFASARSMSNSSLPEPYRHVPYDENGSLRYESSLPQNTSHVAPTVTHQIYQDTGNLASGSGGLSSYTEDMLRPFWESSFIAAFSNSSYRQPSIITEEPKKSTNSNAAPPIISTNEKEVDTFRAQFPPPYIGAGEANHALHNAPDGNPDCPDGPGVPLDLYGDRESQQALPIKAKPGELGEENTSDEFPTLYESEGADHEWLYSLHTECAVPGAVCECGDSCCCPGCFTHTNNPGDKHVYNAMLQKLAGLTGDEEEQAEGNLGMSTENSPSSADSKL